MHGTMEVMVLRIFSGGSIMQQNLGKPVNNQFV
jgi:hypothetical protein